MVLHSSGDEKVCISRASKGSLKPKFHQLVKTYRFWCLYHFAIFTNGWEVPSFRASILYPRLCQSMMILLLLTRPTSQTRARVGILGGFLEHELAVCFTHQLNHTWTMMNSGGEDIVNIRV